MLTMNMLMIQNVTFIQWYDSFRRLVSVGLSHVTENTAKQSKFFLDTK